VVTEAPALCRKFLVVERLSCVSEDGLSAGTPAVAAQFLSSAPPFKVILWLCELGQVGYPFCSSGSISSGSFLPPTFQQSSCNFLTYSFIHSTNIH
jgi:hypothetical protein